MLRIDPSRQALKFLDQLTPKHGRQIAAKLLQLRGDPHPPDSKGLKGFDQPYLRATVGEYRIVYRVEEDTLKVVIIGKRNDDEVYRQLRRL